MTITAVGTPRFTNQFNSDWTVERVAMLERLVEARLSAKQIAMEMGGVSRSAVIGKASRLGFVLRGSGCSYDRLSDTERAARIKRRLDQRSRKERERRAGEGRPAKPKRNLMPRTANMTQGDRLVYLREMQAGLVPEVPHVVDAEIPIEQRRTLMQLTHGCCKWPVGHPRDPDFFFCGAPAVDGKPYCEAHCLRAYDRVSA